MRLAGPKILRCLGTLAVFLAGVAVLHAQPEAPIEPDEDLIRAPRLEESPRSARLTPQENGDERVLEEVIVINESEWRLPDLGSEWRRQQAELGPQGRIHVSFFPLFDPESADPFATIYPGDKEMGRTGFIEIFRVRFGGRSRD